MGYGQLVKETGVVLLAVEAPASQLVWFNLVEDLKRTRYKSINPQKKPFLKVVHYRKFKEKITRFISFIVFIIQLTCKLRKSPSH